MRSRSAVITRAAVLTNAENTLDRLSAQTPQNTANKHNKSDPKIRKQCLIVAHFSLPQLLKDNSSYQQYDTKDADENSEYERGSASLSLFNWVKNKN